MSRNNRVFVSPMVTDPEVARLDADLTAILDTRGLHLARHIRDRLFEELLHAVGRAKPGPDLQAAAQSDRKGYDWMFHHITAVRSRRKPIRAPDIARPEQHKSMQVAPVGRGRPGNTAQDLLMLDIRRALGAAGLPRGFKAGDENLLSEVLRACARVAGLGIPDELKHLWENIAEIK
jgi:hypothetical protein